ncbi:MAG: aspartate kinase [Holdemanella sp.]|nr:aspartate kinase [Holdemanella sp.]
MNVVEKYGGTSVATIDNIKKIAKHVADVKKRGDNIIVVASAMGKTTNKLIEMAKEIGNTKNSREMDSLLSTGEQRTITLLAMAIETYGVKAISLTGFQAGFVTSNHHAHAYIKDINDRKIKKYIKEGYVVVVAGFQGATENGEITTLGRGGSDTTAVALAAKLHYDCYIYTDVNGVYTCDPRIYPKAKKLKEVTYMEMMQMAILGSGVLETRSVELASKYNVKLYLGRSLNEDFSKGTYIMKQTKNLEDMPITGISIKDDYAILRVTNIKNDGIFLSKLFNLIAKLNINLDTISQQLNDDGTVNFTFYCNKAQSDEILDNAKELECEYPIKRMLGFVKLSLVGVGISTHSGIAAKVLNTLNMNNIRYYQITSSEISISLTIDEANKKVAVEKLCEVFDL